MKNDYLLIIDGSSLLSTQYYGNLPREILYAKTEEERALHYHKLMQTSTGIFTNGIYGFMKQLFSLLKNQKPHYLAVCWDITRDTFRREIYNDYKGHRKSTPEPLKQQFVLCQELLQKIGVMQFMSEQYEADDYAGSLASRFETEVPIRIMTKDRDYLQLVDEQVNLWLVTSSQTKAAEFNKRYGLQPNVTNTPEGMLYLNKELVEKEFGFPPEKTVMVKQLAGDTADNIPGVKGIGEKTAIALANAYPSIEEMYDEIRDLSKKELDIVKNRWKEELGIKRSPMNYLLAQKEDELVGEQGSIISKKLATIKRDIDLSAVSLSDLQVCLNGDAVGTCFRELEFQSLSLEQLDEQYYTGSIKKEINLQTQVISDKKNASQIIQKALNAEKVSISILVTDKKPEQKLEQLDLFTYLNGEIEEPQVSKKELIAFALSFSLEQAFVFTGNDFLEEDMLSYLTQLYEGNCQIVSFDIKEHLAFLSRDIVNRLLLEDSEQHMPAFDVTVAAYLLNPLKSNDTPANLCAVYYHEIDDRTHVLGKKVTTSILTEQYEEVTALLAQEAEAAFALSSLLQKQLSDTGMWKLFVEVEMPTLYTLYEMEHNGIHVEKAALKQYGQQLTSSIDALEKAIYEKAGKEFNIQSPKQLGVVLFEELGLPKGKKTKTGYSTSAEVLEGLRTEYAIVNDILEYRQLTKLRSTYAEGLENYIQEDGRIHGHFNQTVTATGRISSTEPNLQNIPMRTELGRAIRKVFLPEDGACFVDADYSQIELRVLAHMSKDETLLTAFQEEQDIHTLTASQVFHVPFEEVTDLMRRNAKAVNFGIVYGISAHGLSVDLGISRKEAADYMDGYFATYPKVKQFLDDLVEEGRKNGCVRTMFGRIRPIPELHSTNYNQRSFGERVAMNSPIQGTAADIMKIAMIKTYRSLLKAGLRSRLVLQIHDELLIETYDDEKAQVKAILEDAMSNACQMDVALAIDCKEGATWYDAK